MSKVSTSSAAILPARETSAATPQHVQPVPSPCIQVCRLDAAGVCEGCHRTREEITLWTRLTESQQRAVLDRCRERAGTQPAAGA